MKSSASSKTGIGIVLAVLATFGHFTAQITDPLPSPLPSGLSVRIEPWLTIPASSPSAVKARINHLKPCPDGSRLFCNDLRGKLWAIADTSASEATEFLDLVDHFPDFIDAPGLGAGFTSFDFHPEFSDSGATGYGKFYTSHTETASGTPDFVGPETITNLQVAIVTEWTLHDSSSLAIVQEPDNFTRREILRVGFPHQFHGMQEIAFDPTAAPGSDNYGCLFVCIGDGGALVVDLDDNTGRIDSALGTILRLTPVLVAGHLAEDFTSSANGEYFIPESNPFISASDPTPGDGFPVVREIYAYGFRNPHRITWDGPSGKMLCGNIGESSVEEIELVEAGTDHGWPRREGSFFFDPDDNLNVDSLPFPDSSGLRYPVSQYDHDEGDFAVVGGLIYRGAAVPALEGQYLFGDIASGRLFVAEESAMVVPATTSTGSSPAPPRLLMLESAGAATDFKAILGRNRADLRFGTDHQGEAYLLSKQDGGIYRVLADPDPSGTAAAPRGDLEDWGDAVDFESGEHGLVTAPLSSAQVVDDPVEGAANRVLRIRSAGDATLKAYLPIAEIPDDGYGTVFFRFLITDDNHKASFGLSGESAPDTTGDLENHLRSGDENDDPLSLELLEDGLFEPSTPLVPLHWYSVWMVMDTEDDVWDLYLQGGPYSAPTLIRSNVSLIGSGDDGLRTFFWQLAPGEETLTTSAVYFDDLRVDSGHANTTTPGEPRWYLIDDFETNDPLAAWELPDEADQSLSVLSEPDGNRYLSRSASSSSVANPLAIAARELPFSTQVGQSVTLFFRARIDSSDLLHNLGLSSFNPPDASAFDASRLAAQVRISGGGSLELYDGIPGADDFISGNPASLEIENWYRFWLVCSNRGIASGGQTWRAWIKGGAFTDPTPLGPELYFRYPTEAPITRFLAFATSLSEAENDSLCLDDLHLFPGSTLDDPLAARPVASSIETPSPGIATISCPTHPNRMHRLHVSPDLVTWSPSGDFIEGTGEPGLFEIEATDQSGFFQVFEESPRWFVDTSWSSDFAGTLLSRGIQLSPGSSWTRDPGLLTLATNAPQVTGMVRRPGAYALLPGEWRNYELTLETRTLAPDTTTDRDICLIFGYRDETHFYYVHLSSLSDGNFHNIIMKVDGDNRETIQTPPLPAPALGSDWQSFRLCHSADGAISIHVDDEANPRMHAIDPYYRSGRVGFGSFNDTAEFRFVEVSGQCR
ncbi:MAG: PQQ-dependent sugar dehydrogenase [Verrucomicrobiota bacterium]